ncbi:protein Mpv17-like [Montipora foliosa]|uniref:protein Mpv17-like n=1 Tax=Montipora foliosa TaxID=591990 RepID=UPI0035F1DBFC
MVRSNPISKIWSAYQRCLSTKPWRTQLLTSAVMFTASDILTQQLVEKKGSFHDGRRTLRMCIMGVIVGPIQRTWLLTLERFLPPTSKVQIVKKLIIDQTIYGPFIVFFFYTLSGTLAGKNPLEIKQLLQERYIKTMSTAYKVWPIVQTVNFTLIPVQHRANFVQLVSLCWNMYLTWMSNKPVISQEVQDESQHAKSNLSTDIIKKN